jgi:hypothetical protein
MADAGRTSARPGGPAKRVLVPAHLLRMVNRVCGFPSRLENFRPARLCRDNESFVQSFTACSVIQNQWVDRDISYNCTADDEPTSIAEKECQHLVTSQWAARHVEARRAARPG